MSTADPLPNPKPSNAAVSTENSPSDRDCHRFEASAPCDGHTKALADLYREHKERWLRILTAQTGCRDAAKEVLHEAYAKMLELDRPETPSFLGAYLWKLAQNLAIDRRRREATRARLDPVAVLGFETSAPSSEELLCEHQLVEMLEKAIDKLPPDWFEAFVLRVQHGLTFREIARRMNIAERTAQLHVARALEYCHSYLDAAQATRREPR